jgi:protein SCO1/2
VSGGAHGRSRPLAAALAVLFAVAAPASSGDGHGAHATHGDHAGHGGGGTPYRRSVARYEIPDVRLTSSDGASVELRAALARPGPVLVNFIFTSCDSICPVMSATFSALRQREEAGESRFVSISIDPEHDRPERLAAYARRHGADPRWQFLTGEREAVVRVQQAFDAYRGAKANHVPLTFLRANAEAPWVRIEGLASAQDLAGELARLAPP